MEVRTIIRREFGDGQTAVLGGSQSGEYSMGNNNQATKEDRIALSMIHGTGSGMILSATNTEEGFYAANIFLQVIEQPVRSFELNSFFSSGTTSSADQTTQRSPLTDTSVESGTNALSFMSSTAD